MRTSYQQPETDVRNFSICKGKGPAPLACSITQRNATDMQLRKLIPQRNETEQGNILESRLIRAQALPASEERASRLLRRQD